MTYVHTLAAALILAIGGATAASAATVTESTMIKASPDKVWAASASDFCGIGQFHPAVEKCELSEGGKMRTLSLKGGGTIVEKQTANKDGKSYSYIIVESPAGRELQVDLLDQGQGRQLDGNLDRLIQAQGRGRDDRQEGDRRHLHVRPRGLEGEVLTPAEIRSPARP